LSTYVFTACSVGKALSLLPERVPSVENSFTLAPVFNCKLPSATITSPKLDEDVEDLLALKVMFFDVSLKCK
jgi:hypothetical protein